MRILYLEDVLVLKQGPQWQYTQWEMVLLFVVYTNARGEQSTISAILDMKTAALC